jgi:hypothetical protein
MANQSRYIRAFDSNFFCELRMAKCGCCRASEATDGVVMDVRQ